MDKKMLAMVAAHSKVQGICYWAMPAAKGMAVPSSAKPSPLIWVCVATRCFFVVELTSSILIAPSVFSAGDDPDSDPLC